MYGLLQVLSRLKPNYKISNHCVLCCFFMAGPRSASGNVTDYRCVFDRRSRGREFDPGLVPLFREIDHKNYFYGHSRTFR